MTVISLSGKQYLVSEGERFLTNRLAVKEGDSFEVSDMVSGSEVMLKNVENIQGEKIRVDKFKAKKGYRRTIGSRAKLSRVEVVSIGKKTVKKSKNDKQD